MSMKEKIIVVLEELCTSDAVEIHNTYCQESRNPDDIIYDMYDFDEVFHNSTPTEIVEQIGDFSTNDDYFTIGIYGVDSFTCIDDCTVWFPSDIANFAIRNDEDFGNDDIMEILDEEEYEDD